MREERGERRDESQSGKREKREKRGSRKPRVWLSSLVSPLSSLYTPHMARSGFLLLRYIRYLARFKLTPYGRVLVFLSFFAALGSITVEIPIYQLFCALFFLPAAVEGVGTLLRPRLDVRCQLPERATVGVPLTGLISLGNRGFFTAFDLMVGFFELNPALQHRDADRVVASLRAGGEADIPFELISSRRGRFPLVSVQVHSTFPFNLMRFGGSGIPLPSLTVIPAYESLDSFDVPIGNRGRPTHPAPLLGAKGDSPEYVGNREYVLGEAAVRLDFRAWARLGRPVVREYQDEFSFRTGLILDTWQPPTWQPYLLLDHEEKQDIQLEAAVSLTAAIAESLHTREIVIDLFAAGPEIYLFRTPQTGARFDSVLELLSTVEGSATDPLLVVPDALTEALESIASVVFVTLNWDERRRVCIERIRESGRGVKVLLVRETPPTLEAPTDNEQFQTIAPRAILAGEVRSL